MRLIVEADGGSRGNPGPAGYGAVVRDAGTGQVLAEVAEAIGTATNNVAEYRALIAGLRAAAELTARATVEVRMDSKLVVEQMSGRWRIKHPDLLPLAGEARRLAAGFAGVRYDWVPRERNAHADRLANEAMDAAAQGRAWSRHTAEPDRAARAADEPGGDLDAGSGPRSRGGGVGVEAPGNASADDGDAAPPAPKASMAATPADRSAAGASTSARSEARHTAAGHTAAGRTAAGHTAAGEQLTIGADAPPAAASGPPAPPAAPATPMSPMGAGTSASSPARASSPTSRAAGTPAPGWAASPTPPTSTIVLRHGETPLSIERRYAGIGDIPLTEHGIAQAQAAAAALARRGDIEVIISSPLKRARQTAAEVAAVVGAEVHEDEGFREVDFGDWEGLTFAEARERWPDHINAWLADPAVAPPGGESMAAAARRVREAKERILDQYRGRTVLIVTHVTPIKVLVRLALLAPHEAMFRMHLETACLSWIDWYDDGPAVLRSFNDVAHLDHRT